MIRIRPWLGLLLVAAFCVQVRAIKYSTFAVDNGVLCDALKSKDIKKIIVLKQH